MLSVKLFPGQVLLGLWGSFIIQLHNCLVNQFIHLFSEPDFPYLEALSPFQPLAMKVCYCPIDTSLSFNQANKVTRELKPQHLVISEQYTKPPLSSPHSTEATVDYVSKTPSHLWAVHQTSSNLTSKYRGYSGLCK